MTTSQPTRTEQHNRLFDQFVKELFIDPEKSIPPCNVSPVGLSKRAKFLANPQNRKGKHEPKNEMPKLNRLKEEPKHA